MIETAMVSDVDPYAGHIMNEIISELLKCQDEQVLTLIVDLDMNRKENEVKLKHLGSELQHLALNIPDSTRDVLMKRLELILQSIEGTISTGSLAILAASNFAKVIPLHYHARARLLADRGFALTEVIYSATNFPLCHVLVFSCNGVRVFSKNGEQLSEITDNQAAAHATHLLKSLAHSGHLNEAKNSGRGVRTNPDPKLKEAIAALAEDFEGPMVIVGAAHAGELPSSLSERSIATNDGCYEHATVADIAKVAHEACDKASAESAQHYFEEVEKLLHEKRLGSGSDEIKQLILAGRVQTLYIEDTAATCINDSELHQLSETDRLISLALQYNGKIVFLPKDSLSKYDAMAAGLRF